MRLQRVLNTWDNNFQVSIHGVGHGQEIIQELALLKLDTQKGQVLFKHSSMTQPPGNNVMETNTAN